MPQSEYQKMYEAETSYFWFVAKQKLVSRITAGLALPRDPAILDLGCGTGINLKNLQELGYAVGLDYFAEAFQYCMKRSADQLVLSPEDVLPFKPGSFDLVITLDSIEHTDNAASMVKEIFRILRPGGRLLITVPAYPSLFGAHDYALGHKLRYTRKSLLSLMSGSGFDVELLGHFFGLVFPAALLLKLFQKRFGSKTETISYSMPSPLNKILLAVCALESWCFPYFRLPFGTTMVALCKKP
jgi:SAM-dependent methyltransferase